MGLLGRLYVHWSVSTPLVFARRALRLMNTNYLAALGTGPPFLFVSNEVSYAELPYVLEIINHTHTILGSVALIQVIQRGARKAITTEAVPDSTLHYFLTVLDSARDASFRFDTVVAAATGACLLISFICATEATVHSAGSDQRRSNHICLCRSFWRHVRIPAKACMGAFVLKPNIQVGCVFKVYSPARICSLFTL
jgi:hypothetical protein